MRRGAVLGILVVAVFPAASAEDFDFDGCKIDSSGIDCREKSSDGGSWWTSPVAQAIYGIGGLGITGAGAFFAYNRVKQRRRNLSDFLQEAETTYARSKERPAEGIPRLQDLRLSVKHRFERGSLEDTQFLELDKRIGDYLVRLRMIDLEQRVPHLPPSLLDDIRTRAADGLLSGADLASIDRRANALSVPAATRADLQRILSSWGGAAPAAPKRRKLAVVVAENR